MLVWVLIRYLPFFRFVASVRRLVVRGLDQEFLECCSDAWCRKPFNTVLLKMCTIWPSVPCGSVISGAMLCVRLRNSRCESIEGYQRLLGGEAEYL